MECSIQRGDSRQPFNEATAETFHLSPNENILTIALINIHYLFLGVHRIVLFHIRPDTGFAGYLKNIRPGYPAGYRIFL
jgi:hypothetical protein